MVEGTKELIRTTSGYLASLAFAVTYLVTIALGADAGTALMRGVVVTVLTLLISRQLLRPVFGSILDAMARDNASKAAAEAEE